MRISDWSSDVCSSDLCYVHDGMSLMLRFCEDLVKHTAIVEIFDLRCFPAAEILAYGDKVQLRENARIFSGHLGVPGAIEIPGRSEEHTSELQSLMRISYAVFCLKKKKTHTNRQTS